MAGPAVPYWALRAGVAVVQGLFGRDESDSSIITALGSVVVVLLAIVLVILLPLGLLFVPLASDNDLSRMRAKVETYQREFEVTIPWREVAAVFAITHNQDFDQATAEAIRVLAAKWLEYHERQVPIYDEKGKLLRIELDYWYTVKSLGTVLDELSFPLEDKERIFLYLEQLGTE